ncbi:MAG: energy-coupling factor transporter transmembrane protein EcfT [Cyanobacteria bacterium P01_E01_bin.6]
MTFGLFVPRHSPIHRLSPGIKLLGMAIAGIGLFFVTDLVWMSGVLVAGMVLVAIARLPWPIVIAQIRPILWVLLCIAGVHAVFTHWEMGVMLAVRFLTLMLLATIVTLTTRTSDMVAAIAKTLQPLKRFGVRPEQLSLMVAIAIRFIPVLLEQIHDIQDAQRARGVERPVITFLVPLLIKTIHMADALVDAIDARCFDP